MYDELVDARNSYSYPPIGLRALKILDDPSEWEQSYQKHQFRTTLELDIHHHDHLASKNDQEILLGVYSVMYWGYITSGSKSVTRCNWLSNGNAKNPEKSISHIGVESVVQTVKNCRELLGKGKYGYALSEIRNLPHVGVSFGSKFLSFLDLENIGVLDDKITRHIVTGSYEHVLSPEILRALAKPKNESDTAAANRFQTFCEMLGSIKAKMNSKKSGWKDVSGAEMCRFRSVDIERALFAIAKYKDKTN